MAVEQMTPSMKEALHQHERIRQAEKDVLAYAMYDDRPVDMVMKDGVWMIPEAKRTFRPWYRRPPVKD